MSHQPLPNTSLPTPRIRMRMDRNNEYCNVDTQTFEDAHIHGCYEIYVNLSGDIAFLHGGSIYDVISGDVIFSRPGEVHCCIYRASCVHGHICIWFEAEEGDLTDFIERLSIKPHVRLTELQRGELLRLLRLLGDPATEPILKTAYFCEMLSFLGNESGEATGIAAHNEDASWKKVREILTYIEENYHQRLSSAQLARTFFLSESTLNRLFRRHVGRTVSHLIEAKRLSHAEQMLREDATVTEACFRSGFSDCSRFIACFKKRFGMTPLQYKKSLLR